MKCSRGWIVVGALAFLSCSGCEPKQPPQSDVPPAIEAPSVAAIVEAHNRRIEHLTTLYARGVVELEWTDEDGDRHHEPQVNIEIWIDRPHRTALRFFKEITGTYIWAGSDDERYWLFDLTGDVRRLTVGRNDNPVSTDADAVFDMKPLALLDLVALSPIAANDVAGDADYNEERNGWVIVVQHTSGRFRYTYSESLLRPTFVEMIDDQGAIFLLASLESYQSPRLQDRAIDPAHVQVAHDMRVRNGAGTARMEFFLDEVTDGLVESQPFDRVFDFDRLQRSMRPDVVDVRSVASTGG